jgi:predicted transcriptional regulator
MGTSTQGIKLDETTRQRLKALGELRDRSPHWLMRVAIERYLDEEERQEREKREDMERWEAYQLTGHAVSHEADGTWLNALAEGIAGPCPK